MPVSWDGWYDTVSGIKEFELDLYKMHPFGDVLGSSHDSKIANVTYNSTLSEHEFVLRDPGKARVKHLFLIDAVI